MNIDPTNLKNHPNNTSCQQRFTKADVTGINAGLNDTFSYPSDTDQTYTNVDDSLNDPIVTTVSVCKLCGFEAETKYGIDKHLDVDHFNEKLEALIIGSSIF